MATQTQRDSFIQLVAAPIQNACKARGYGVPSAIIAQAIIESNWGLSGLAKYNNFFGMKCGSSWTGKSVNMKTKEEYTVGTLTTIKDNFRAYDSVQAGIDGYFDFISSKRYATVRSATTYQGYITQLKLCGYATSSTYINTLCATVQKYGLTKYDDLSYSAPVVQETVQKDNLNPDNYVQGNTYTVQVRLNVRTEPGGDVVKTYAIGTRVTCKCLMWYDDAVWMKTPSGWICTRKGAKQYVK